MAKRVGDRALKKAILLCGGNITAVSVLVGYTSENVRQRIRKSEKLQAALIEARERNLDRAELKLNAAVARGAPWAVKYTLSTIGKERGYTTKVEVDHSGAVGLDITGVDFSEHDDDATADGDQDADGDGSDAETSSGKASSDQ